jgi:hypothetical protein
MQGTQQRQIWLLCVVNCGENGMCLSTQPLLRAKQHGCLSGYPQQPGIMLGMRRSMMRRAQVRGERCALKNVKYFKQIIYNINPSFPV